MRSAREARTGRSRGSSVDRGRAVVLSLRLDGFAIPLASRDDPDEEAECEGDGGTGGGGHHGAPLPAGSGGVVRRRLLRGGPGAQHPVRHHRGRAAVSVPAVDGLELPAVRRDADGGALLHGDIAAAWSFNPVALVGLLVVGILGVLWTLEAAGGPRASGCRGGCGTARPGSGTSVARARSRTRRGLDRAPQPPLSSRCPARRLYVSNQKRRNAPVSAAEAIVSNQKSPKRGPESAPAPALDTLAGPLQRAPEGGTAPDTTELSEALRIMDLGRTVSISSSYRAVIRPQVVVGYPQQSTD